MDEYIQAGGVSMRQFWKKSKDDKKHKQGGGEHATILE
jgi:hypothetical protein